MPRTPPPVEKPSESRPEPVEEPSQGRPEAARATAPRRPARATSAAPPRFIDGIGAVPEGVNFFRLRKIALDGTLIERVSLEHNGVRHEVFPVEHLSLDLLKQFGPARYVVAWQRVDPATGQRAARSSPAPAARCERR